MTKIMGWHETAEGWATAIKGTSKESIAMIAASRAMMAAAAVHSALENPAAATDKTDELSVDAVLDPQKSVFGHGHTRTSGMKKFSALFSTSEQAYENQLVPAISLQGMENTASAITDGEDGKGTGTNYVYKGIEGSAICRGGGCKINDDEEFSANWYFVPIRGSSANGDLSDLSDAYFIKTTGTAGESSSYSQALYAEFGLWLEDKGGDLILQRRAGVGRGSADSGTLDYSGSTTAKYTGKASGLSSLNTADEEDASPEYDSGQFIADVELSLKFGTSPTLSGTVDGFDGSAVGDEWEITFADVELASGSIAHTGTNEGFNATAFGESGEAPTGFFGDFFKHFEDGRAAGVYAATSSE